ncbi:hypothetical protein V1291_000005 [Nitrobacteraceae bacterium AZCC 1564]
MKRDIYIAIMRAAARGNGLRLTALEVADLAIDDAIATAAANGLSEATWKKFFPSNHGPSAIIEWRNIDPCQGEPYNGTIKSEDVAVVRASAQNQTTPGKERL